MTEKEAQEKYQYRFKLHNFQLQYKTRNWLGRTVWRNYKLLKDTKIHTYCPIPSPFSSFGDKFEIFKKGTLVGANMWDKMCYGCLNDCLVVVKSALNISHVVTKSSHFISTEKRDYFKYYYLTEWQNN